MRLIVTILALGAMLANAAEVGLPERFAVTFAVMNKDTRLGETRWTLAPEGDNQYVFETVSRATGLVKWFMKGKRRERTAFQYDANGLRPLAYRYKRSGVRGRQVDIVFDWEQGVAHNTARGTTWKLKLEPGTLDKLLYVLALMHDLGNGEKTLSYRIADGGKLKTYETEVLGREMLDTSLGRLETIIVKPRPPQPRRETTLWCAPALNNLPVQVEHREKGEVTVMRIESLEGIQLLKSTAPERDST